MVIASTRRGTTPIVITGGAGFLGSHVVDLLLDEGFQVVVLDNLSTGRKENLREGVPLYQVDISEDEAATLVRKLQPRYIIHLAAQISVARSVVDPLADLRINVAGTINLLQAAVEACTEKVVFASSGGAIYGEADSLPLKEYSPLRPIFPYGIAKATCEQYLRFFEHQHGVRYVSLRYGNIYGPRQDPEGEAGVVSIFIKKMSRGEKPVINGDGRYVRDYVYVKDAARAVLLGLQFRKSGTYNIGTGRGTDVNELFSSLAELCNFQLPPSYGLPRAGDLRASILDSTSARRELGWEAQISLEQGLGYTLEYFRQQVVGSQLD